MAKNDKILIDGMIDELVQESGEDRGKAFEKFSISEILKNYDISEVDLQDGIVDGRNDGGIDGFYIFLNSRLIKNSEDIQISDGAIIDVFLIQCKHDDSFKQAPLVSLHSSLIELLDLNINKEDFSSCYNDRVIKKREIFKKLYRKFALKQLKLNIKVCYISRGNTTEIDSNISGKSDTIKTMVLDLFSDSFCDVLFLGSEELVNISRKKRNGEVFLKTQKNLRYGEHFVLVVNLKDYFDFLVSEDGELKRYFFEDNVRDYLGSVRTNNDILETLNSTEMPDFWLMNNGITIITDNVKMVGDDEIVMDNVQIVNGMQSSNTIYNYFCSQKEKHDNDCRSILIKVIMKQDENMKKLIIQSTNNQTQIQVGSLMAVEKYQKDIEQYLLSEGFYYNRKDNEHLNSGIDASEIINPLELASIHVALYLKLPFRATQLRQKHFKSERRYDKIYNSEVNIKLWSKYALMLKYLKKEFQIFRNDTSYNLNGKTLQKKFIPIAIFFLISIKFKNYNFSTTDILSIQSIEELNLTENIFTEIISNLETLRQNKIKQKSAPSHLEIKQLIELFSDKYDIKNKDSVLKRRNESGI